MKKLNEMQIYLLDISLDMCEAWQMEMGRRKNVAIVHDDFVSFMNKHPEVETIVSPANAYGYMDGGYDAAISDYVGWGFQKKVQAYIKENFNGEQLLGSSFIIGIEHLHKRLIHTPSMRLPSQIKEPAIVYQCTRSCLLCASENDVTSIVIPAFGKGTGNISAPLVAKLMEKAFEQMESGGDYLRVCID